MGAPDWSGTLVNRREELGHLKEALGPAFKRSELRETAGSFIDGLLSSVDRKTGWMLAQEAGLERPKPEGSCRPGLFLRLCARGHIFG